MMKWPWRRKRHEQIEFARRLTERDREEVARISKRLQARRAENNFEAQLSAAYRLGGPRSG